MIVLSRVNYPCCAISCKVNHCGEDSIVGYMNLKYAVMVSVRGTLVLSARICNQHHSEKSCTDEN